MLAVANHWDEKAPDPKHPIAINSTIYRWDDTSSRFVIYQQIPTIGAEQMRYLTVPMRRRDTRGTEVEEMVGLLAVAQCVDDASGWNTTSQIWELVV